MKSLVFIGILLTISYAGCPLWQCSTAGQKDSCWYIQKQGEQPQTFTPDQAEPAVSEPTTPVEPATAAIIQTQAAEDATATEDLIKPETATVVQSQANVNLLQGDDTVHVGPWCSDAAASSCYISDFRDSPNSGSCKPTALADKEHFSSYLKDKYCSNVNYQEAFNCADNCPYVTDIEEQELYTHRVRNCNITKLRESRPEQNKLLNLNWEACRENTDCASGSCDCVPTSTGQGRCTVSVHDDFYEQAFNALCDEEAQPDSYRIDIEEDRCVYWVLLKLGHWIKALDNYQSALPCLNAFEDNVSLVKISEHLGEDFRGKYLMIPISIGITILLCACWCWRRRKTDAENEQGLLDNERDGANFGNN